MKSPGFWIALLAVALGAALWGLWDMRGRVDVAQVEIDRLAAQGDALRDSLDTARQDVDRLQAEVTAWTARYDSARRRFTVHRTPVGAAVVLEGDPVPQPIPLAVADALQACDALVTSCQAGLERAQAALGLAVRRAEVAESALVVWEGRPPKKPKFGFQAGLLVGVGLSIAAALAFN